MVSHCFDLYPLQVMWWHTQIQYLKHIQNLVICGGISDVDEKTGQNTGALSYLHPYQLWQPKF